MESQPSCLTTQIPPHSSCSSTALLRPNCYSFFHLMIRVLQSWRLFLARFSIHSTVPLTSSSHLVPLIFSSSLNKTPPSSRVTSFPLKSKTCSLILTTERPSLSSFQRSTISSPPTEFRPLSLTAVPDSRVLESKHSRFFFTFSSSFSPHM